MPPPKLLDVNALARRQHGVVCRAQALECAYSDSAIGRCVASGRWQRVARGVYLVGAGPRRFETDVMALVLRAPGRTWASHRTAARLWGIDPEGPAVVQVSSTARISDPRARHVPAMPPEDRRAVGAIPVTGVERTLADVAAVASGGRLERMVVEALRRGLTDVRRLTERIGNPSGRSGRARLRRLLAGWHGQAPPESVLERRLGRLIATHGLPPGIPQWKVSDRGQVVARIDLAYPEEMVAIEADGYRWHSDPGRWRADLARRQRPDAPGLAGPSLHLERRRRAPRARRHGDTRRTPAARRAGTSRKAGENCGLGYLKIFSASPRFELPSRKSRLDTSDSNGPL